MTTLRTLTTLPSLLAMVAAGILAGCSQTSKSADVSAGIRTALAQSGLTAVSVSQDRDKGVVTLGGQVSTDNDKAHAEEIAKTIAGTQVVAVQIAVVQAGEEHDAKAINADLDKGIEQNLDAALIQNNLHDDVKYAVKNHVVTLTGDVDSQAKRHVAGQVAASVPNVQQVVNELQVKHQKATSSE